MPELFVLERLDTWQAHLEDIEVSELQQPSKISDNTSQPSDEHRPL